MLCLECKLIYLIFNHLGRFVVLLQSFYFG